MKVPIAFCMFFQAVLSFGQTNLTLHNYKVENIFGDSISLSEYAGKKLMVVNTASFCGYTHQFSKLQQLDSMYSNLNFRVIGFPCNDFGGQDPFADSTILSFCMNQYGVTFPMMRKIFITLGDTAPVYKWLQKKSLNGASNASVTWNFNKFLIDEQGNWVRHFVSNVEPNDTAIVNWILRGSVTKTEKSHGFHQWKVQNPSSGKIQFFGDFTSHEKLKYELMDLSGKTIQTGVVPESRIVYGDFCPGIYLLRLSSPKELINYRLVVN
jgi:glutathione peroxidase